MSKKAKSEDRQIAEELAKEVAQLTEALQRERADAMNIRRRHEEQITSLRTSVKSSVVRELLPAIDNLERALKHVPKDIAKHDYVKGVSGVVKQFEKVLADIGVERIKTVGEHFDPEFHEAVAMDGGDGHHEIISEELQPGYMLGGEVIRHAMVKVKK
ncbi:nucleotide exchange factor GrpE [Candidatus Saccharibacteria bacterium RIFCSPHIGHO2_12_FULL_41_12]|nr:MAG: nucleotide exchange factor GrpE [Candidatus Saccharibacteria bacterium RIFCSPHIGHO2_12_FULL_41_12]